MCCHIQLPWHLNIIHWKFCQLIDGVFYTVCNLKYLFAVGTMHEDVLHFNTIDAMLHWWLHCSTMCPHARHASQICFPGFQLQFFHLQIRVYFN